ncbi:MAG: Cna B-type domain-containing protein [Clostridia bacterium]|nr:Cna B-type domain-containing protein [Clostridia bacterium]
MIKKNALLSLILALILMVSLSPAGAAETNQVTASQQSVTYYYDAAGRRLTNATSLSGNAVVEMKKWAEQRKDASGNPIENEFMVTLQVRTTERIEELSSDTPDAAVTLVVDVSNSMDDCYHCGQEASHINHGGIFYKCPGNRNTYFEGSNTNSNTRCDNCDQRFRNHTYTNVTADHTYESRLKFAQAAALDFIDQFANETGAEEGDKRYVALITFGSHAAARTQYIDVATESGKLAAELAIKNITVANSGVRFTDSDGDSVTDPGGTNIEGGLMLADNMIAANTASGRALDGIHYLYTILLTDGTPTYYVNGDDASTTAILGTRGGGSSTTKEDAKDVGTEAAKILAHSPQSRLFSICFGTDSTGDDVWDSTPFQTWNDANPPTSSQDTVGEWLQKFSSAAYDASNLDGGLFDSFESVITQIQLAAQAWHVTDQMGPHINYLGNALVSTGSGVISNDVSITGDTMKWNILGSQPDPRISTVTTQNGVTTGILGYTCQYYISLDNLDSAYTNKTDSTATNTQALLTYATKDNNDEWKIVDDAPFPEPEVKGLVGSFTFKKINEEGEALPGIQFTLRDMVDGVDYTRTATSDANGMVTFTGIPSGHSYRLDEQTDASDKFLDLGDILFDISWGEFIPKSSNIEGSANGYFITNHYGPDSLSGLTLEKIFDGDRPEDAHYVEFTLRGARNHNMNYVQTIRLNNANNWRNTFANLEPGWYTLEEITSFEGYDNTLKIEYTVMKNGQLVTKELIDHDGNGSYDIQLDAMDQYTEYTATVTNTLKRHAGDVTIQKTFYEHDLNATTDQHMEGLTPLAEDLYSHIQVAVSATPQGASTPYATIYLNKDNGFKATFNDLPAGVYTLSETVTGDVKDHAFEHSLFLRNGQEVTRTLTVHKDDNISLELQNHYRHYLGRIRVEKVVTGDLTNDNELLQNKTFVVQVYSVDEEKLIATLYLDAQHDWVDSTLLIPVGHYHLVEKSQDASIDGFTWLEEKTTLTGDVKHTDDETGSVIIEVTPGEEAYVAQTVILTNVYERQEGKLVIKKAFADDSDLKQQYFADKDIPFEIFVEGPNQFSQTLYLNKDNNWEETIDDLPVGHYTITERANIDGYLHTFEITNHGAAVITDKGEAVITVTNKYEEIKGGLIVEKTYKLRGADRDTVLSEDMKHLLHDAKVEVTATHKETGESFPLTLDSHNDFKTVFTDLSLGEYTLTEKELVALPGYHLVEHTFAPDTLTIENATDHPKALLTNVYARDTGSITVEKQFAPDSDLDQQAFEDKGLSIHLTLTSEDGVSVKEEFTFNKENGWSKSFDNLPSGKYFITESAQVAGYDLSAVIMVNDWPVTDGMIEITNHDEDINVVIANHYSQQKGSLKVTKAFVDEAGEAFDAAQVRDLKIKVTAVATLDASITGSVILDADNRFSGEIGPLPIGVYELTEEVIAGSIPDYSLIDHSFSPATASIARNEVALISLTNVYGRDAGSLKVEKVFGQGSHLTQKDFEDQNRSIQVTVTGPNGYNEEIIFNQANGWSKTLHNLPTGEYLVTEADASVPGYALSAQITASGAASVGKDSTVTITLTNTYTRDVGKLTVQKLFGDDSDLKAEHFTDRSIAFTVTGPDNYKEEFTFNQANGWIKELENLPTGTYTVTESAQVDGYTLSADLPNNGEIQVGKDAPVTFTCVNTYTTIVGGLTVNKVFLDDQGNALPADLYKDLTIKVTAVSVAGPAVTGTAVLNVDNGFTATIADLPVGDYTLTEEVPEAINGYTLAKSKFNPKRVTVTNGAAAVASSTLTNTYTRDTGSITVEKQFDANSALSKDDFEADNLSILVTLAYTADPDQVYEVTLNKDNGWRKTVSDLPTGQYQITETAQVDGYGLTTTITGAQVTGSVVTLEKDAAVSVIITNLYDPYQGTLRIEKTINGDTEKAPDELLFTVSDDKGNSYSVAVKKENSWIGTIFLPIGEYTITEQVENGSDFRVNTVMTPADGKVTIRDGETVTVTCTNTYEALTSVRIPVEKTVVQTGNVAPGHNTFAFQAKLNVPATVASSVTMAYQNDPANADGTFQGVQNADTFYIAVQDAATVKGWIVLSGFSGDLKQVTLSIKETSDYATAEDAAAAHWMLDDTVFGDAEWHVSIDQQCQPVIRRSDAEADAAAAAFTNTYTKIEQVVIPGTGDDGMPFLWMALTALSLCGIAILMIRKRKEA